MGRTFVILLTIILVVSCATAGNLLDLVKENRAKVLAQRPEAQVVPASQRTALVESLANNGIMKAFFSSLNDAGIDLASVEPSISRAFVRDVDGTGVKTVNVYYRTTLDSGLVLVLRVTADVKGEVDILELAYRKIPAPGLGRPGPATLAALSAGEKDRLKSVALAHELIKPLSADLLNKDTYEIHIPPHARDNLIALSFIPLETSCIVPLSDEDAAAAEAGRDQLCASCQCPAVTATVCGEDWITYANPCLAKCAGTTVRSGGRCLTQCPEYGTILVLVDVSDWSVKEVYFREARAEVFGPVIACEPDSALSLENSRTMEAVVHTLDDIALELVRYKAHDIADKVRAQARELTGSFGVADECTTNEDCSFSSCSCSCGPTSDDDLDCLRSCSAVHTCVCKDGVCMNDEPKCVCPDLFDPVCGSDGVTYPTACDAACAGADVAHQGSCPDAGCIGANTFLVQQDSLAKVGNDLVAKIVGCQGIAGPLADSSAVPVSMGRDWAEFRLHILELPQPWLTSDCERRCRDGAAFSRTVCETECALASSECKESCRDAGTAAITPCIAACLPDLNVECDTLCNATLLPSLGVAEHRTLSRGVPITYLGYELTLESIDADSRTASLQVKDPEARILTFTPDYDDADARDYGPFSVLVAAGVTRLADASADIVLAPAVDDVCMEHCRLFPPPRYDKCMTALCRTACEADSDLQTLCADACADPDGWADQGLRDDACANHATFAACMAQRCMETCQDDLDKPAMCAKDCKTPFAGLSAYGDYATARTACVAAGGDVQECLQSKCTTACTAVLDVGERCRDVCGTIKGWEDYGGIDEGRNACAGTDNDYQACMVGACTGICTGHTALADQCQQSCTSPAAWKVMDDYEQNDVNCRIKEQGSFAACTTACNARTAVWRSSCADRCLRAATLYSIRTCKDTCQATSVEAVGTCVTECASTDPDGVTACKAACGTVEDVRKTGCLAGCKGPTEACAVAREKGDEDMLPAEGACTDDIAVLHTCKALVRFKGEGLEDCPPGDARCGLTKTTTLVRAGVDCERTYLDDAYLDPGFCRRTSDCVRQPGCCECDVPRFVNRFSRRPVVSEGTCACTTPPDIAAQRWAPSCVGGECTAEAVSPAVYCETDTDCVHADACCDPEAAACINHRYDEVEDCTGIVCMKPDAAPTSCLCVANKCISQAVTTAPDPPDEHYSLYGSAASADAVCGDGLCVPGEDGLACSEDCAIG